MDKYFILSTFSGGLHIDECDTYQQACQIIIAGANYDYPEEDDFEFIEIIKGRVICSI